MTVLWFAIGILAGDRFVVWRRLLKTESFAVKAQLRNHDQFNRIEQRLPTFNANPVYPADQWRENR